MRLRLCRCRVWCSPIVERAVATSGRPSAVDVEGSLVRWHPSHVGAIWAASVRRSSCKGWLHSRSSGGGRRCRRTVTRAERAEELSFARCGLGRHKCVGEFAPQRSDRLPWVVRTRNGRMVQTDNPPVDSFTNIVKDYDAVKRSICDRPTIDSVQWLLCGLAHVKITPRCGTWSSAGRQLGQSR